MSMNFDKFTDRSRVLSSPPRGLAARANHQQLLPEHLLKVLIEDQGLRQHGSLARACDAAAICQVVQEALNRLPTVEGSGAGQVYLSGSMTKVMTQAEDLADKAGDSFVAAEYLLLALAMVPDTGAHRVLSSAGIDQRKPQCCHRRLAQRPKCAFRNRRGRL